MTMPCQRHRIEMLGKAYLISYPASRWCLIANRTHKARRLALSKAKPNVHGAVKSLESKLEKRAPDSTGFTFPPEALLGLDRESDVGLRFAQPNLRAIDQISQKNL